MSEQFQKRLIMYSFGKQLHVYELTQIEPLT